jgi:hypothetical protein
LINVFLDDLRKPPEGFVLARTIDECILLLSECDVHTLSLDYNLEPWGRRTGYDVAKFIVDSNRWPRVIYLHTNDPAGRERMFSLLTRYKPAGVEVYNRRMQT